MRSQCGCRGPLDVPLWAPLWVSMRNELEQNMWATHIIALGLGISICDIGLELVSIRLQEVPVIREGVGQSISHCVGSKPNPRGSLSGPVTKTQHSQCKRPGFDSWPGNLDPICLN